MSKHRPFLAKQTMLTSVQTTLNILYLMNLTVTKHCNVYMKYFKEITNSMVTYPQTVKVVLFISYNILVKYRDCAKLNCVVWKDFVLPILLSVCLSQHRRRGQNQQSSISLKPLHGDTHFASQIFQVLTC